MFLDEAWLAFSVFFETAQWIVLPIAVLAALTVVPRRRIFLQALIITILASFALKLFFHQDRPCVLEDALVACPPDFGMPSIHAAMSGLFFMAALGSSWAWLIFPLSMAVAYSRVFLNVHTPEQVIAGFALAVVTYLMTWLIVQRKEAARK